MHFSLASWSLLRIQATRRLVPALLLPVLLFTGGCVSEPSAVTGQKQSFGYSWEQEVQLGAEADKEITAEMGLYDHPALQSYVESVGNRVVQASGIGGPNTPEMYRDTKFTFRVMDSPVVNAFALPGGYMYVTRGLLSHVQNEAQLAVVLGHELAHVLARHSSQQARRAQLGQIGLIAGAILGQQVLGDKVGDMGQLLNLGSNALGLFMMRYSREAEYESDSLGVGYAQRAGYQAAESAKFFQSLQRISAAEGRAIPTWQSTHPDPGDRASRVVEIAAKTPSTTAQSGMVGEDQYLNFINGMVVGDDPREGFARNGVFYHPTLKFQFPIAPGWKLDNQKAAVVMAEPKGQALMGMRLTPESRARDAAAKFVEGAKIQVVASGDTQINGLPTTVIVGRAQAEEGNVGVWNAFIEYEGRVYSMLGYSPEQIFNQLRPTFESVAAGFSPLRDPSLANVQPARLKIVRADRNAPFASFIPTSLPGDMTPEAVAILNQVQLNEPVTQGRILKIPDTTGATPAPPGATAPNYPAPRASQPSAYPPNQAPGQPGAYPQPPATYPPQQQPPANYPPQSGYPPQPGQPTTYPPQAQPYPPQSPQPNYPPQGSPTYPPQNYPPQTYPPQSYPPQNYPGGAPAPYPQPAPAGGYPPPNFPR